MSVTDLKAHPYADIFPMMSGPELDALARDIKDNGLQMPIYLLDGMILDGRNRYRACMLADVEPRFEIWQPGVPLDDVADSHPLRWVISLNLHRRHLTPSQRSAVAVEILPMLEADALERKRLAGKHKENFADVVEGPKGQAREHAAALLGVNHRYVSIVKLLKLEAPDLYERVKSGDLVAVEAEAMLKGRRSREANLLRIASAEAMPEDERIILRVGDFRQVLNDIEPNSVDMILTDPPYPREFLHLWEPLGELGARVLKPGGVLVSYSGHYWLGEVIMALKKNLTYCWTFCLRMSGGGGTRLMRHSKISTVWKPVVYFYKPPFKEPAHGIISDLVEERGTRSKTYHEWQQGESGVSQFMALFTTDNDLIVDPFLGGGTTAVVARDMRRRFIGTDIDEESVMLTRARLQESTGGNGANASN